jgi:hypothetical protein
LEAPRGVPRPRTFNLERRPVRAAFSRSCSFSASQRPDVHQAHPSTKVSLDFRATLSPPYCSQPGSPGVGCRYASPASEAKALEPVQGTTQRLPARYGTWGSATGTSRHVLGPGVSRGCCRASVVTRQPSFPYLPLVLSLPAAFFASPLISPPTSKRCPARGSRFVGGFANPAKFILVQKGKNATHATKTRNRYVRFFCNRILYSTSKRALSARIPCAFHRRLWREIWWFEVGVQGRQMRGCRVATLRRGGTGGGGIGVQGSCPTP